MLVRSSPFPCKLTDGRNEQGPRLRYFFDTDNNIIEHSDRILALKDQEDTKYHYEIYVRGFKSHWKGTNELPLVDPQLRGRICAWNFRVVDHCNFPRELAERSLSFFDRCMVSCGTRCLTEDMAWLTGMAALHLAIKIHHTAPIGVDFLVSLSRNQFTVQQILAMENLMMRSLLWYLHSPTATEFAYSFVSLLPSNIASSSIKEEIFERSKIILQSSICEAFFVPFRTSSTAFAAVTNVMEDMALLQEGNNLTYFFEEQIGCQLLHLVNGCEEYNNVKLLREKMRELAWVASE